ncbi:MAG: DUF512 domain-containing protein [Fibrobacter sp.]|nr:DUF512 domain-containing protein [Fibrobacter sp.]
MTCGIKIRSISKKSPFFSSGLRKGDRILQINGERICDDLDFMYYSAEDFLDIIAEKNGKTSQFFVPREEGCFNELEFDESPINTCKNRCIFCFIDQMPPGLRKGLYIKDEDLRHSFLNGNYVTLSSATSDDLEKVAKIGLSPLFISVHATDTDIRNRMLRNNKAPAILEQLKFLEGSGIRFHTQIVLCPGYNDGKVLKKTICDLFNFKNSLLSVAIVPVGLTRFRKSKIQNVNQDIALKVCNEINALSDKYLIRDGVRKLFLADEFFIKADLPIPVDSYYEDYPQIQNGIGLVRQLMDQAAFCKIDAVKAKKNIDRDKKLVLTSKSAYPFLKRIVSDFKNSFPEFNTSVLMVENSFFGDSVTVAGLLTAADVIKTLKKSPQKNNYEKIILPSVMFNYAGFTLDGYSAKRLSRKTGYEIKTVNSLEELVFKSKYYK